MPQLNSDIEAIEIFGVPLSTLDSYPQVVEYLFDRIKRQEKTFCVAINPEKIQRARQDRELLRLIRQANLQICDGVGTVIAARLLHGRKIARITGVQLFLNLIAAAEHRQVPVFLLGASSESNRGAAQSLLQRHHKLRLAGYQDGYFTDSKAVVDRINRSGAQLVFVAMGSPHQEQWIADHHHQIAAPFCMGVGGSFDVLSGQATWAPEICRKTGTEFLYRLLREPRRWRRQLCLPVFAGSVLSRALLQKLSF